MTKWKLDGHRKVDAQLTLELKNSLEQVTNKKITLVEANKLLVQPDILVVLQEGLDLGRKAIQRDRKRRAGQVFVFFTARL
ncbi:MAG: hypothetical protein WC314_27710 [Vulcanimicrobiota bacterium]